MFNLAFRKVFGLLNHWIILNNREEFDSIISMCSDVKEIDTKPRSPKNYPVFALFRDVSDENYCGIDGTYVYIWECREFLKSAGFVVEMSEELKNKKVEW